MGTSCWNQDITANCGSIWILCSSDLQESTRSFVIFLTV